MGAKLNREGHTFLTCIDARWPAMTESERIIALGQLCTWQFTWQVEGTQKPYNEACSR